MVYGGSALKGGKLVSWARVGWMVESCVEKRLDIPSRTESLGQSQFGHSDDGGDVGLTALVRSALCVSVLGSTVSCKSTRHQREESKGSNTHYD